MSALSSDGPPVAHPAYRPDIDGLRAIAVLSVVGYHALPAAVPGGFVGVDIFFVISGYLITTIILGTLARGRFSYADFYARRIKRIFPALIVVLAAVWVAGWLRLFPHEYRQLGKHIAGGAGFVSNFLLRGDAGYFDATSEAKPLLHLWSLAIEEQFYIFWPLILAFAVRRAAATWAIVAIAIASFAFGYSMLDLEPSTAFYSPLSRFWELMIGGMLAQVIRSRPALFDRYREARAVLGLALLAIAIAQFTRTVPYPGWRALLPTVGAFLLISAGPQTRVNRLVLSNPIAVWFGKISYPLYLWHWPLLSFLYIEDSDRPTARTRALLVVASIVLAWVTTRVIETPIRTSPRSAPLALGLFATMALVGALGYATYLGRGFGERFDARGAYAASFDDTGPELTYRTSNDLVALFREECNFYDFDAWRLGHSSNRPRESIDPTCYTRPPGTTRAVFVWGDSHAQHLNVGLRAFLPKDVAILQVATSGCPAALADEHDTTALFCRTSNRFAWSAIRREPPDVVVIAQRENHSLPRLRDIAIALKRAGVREVVVVGPVPQWKPDLNRIIASRYWDDTPDHLSNELDTEIVRLNRRLETQLRPDEPFVFVDVFATLCDRRGCTTFLDGDKRDGLITFDYGHLTSRSSVYLVRTAVGPAVLAALERAETSPTSLQPK